MTLPLALYAVLLCVAVFAPLRWAIAAYLVLSTVDFYTGYGGVGILNAIKGLAYPVFLLWRLRAFAGHGKLIAAPIAWLLLSSYAVLASFWSAFPLSGIKLAGEMLGSFLICLAFLRASKAGYLLPSVVTPVTCGVLAIAILRSLFAPSYGDTPDRFTAFTSAQTLAALLTALFALALCSSSLKLWQRSVICTAIFPAMVLNGSRVWLAGLLLILLLGLLISTIPAWLKICSCGVVLLMAVTFVAASDPILDFLARSSRTNRVASIITAIYQGDRRSAGLGTLFFRRQLNARTLSTLASSSATELLFGHGTSNGRFLLGDLNRGIGDPNRAVHNEWLRILYEWGILGFLLWLLFAASLTAFAWRGFLRDARGYAKPLLVYLPALALALTSENILAGAGHAENIGTILLIAIAGISYRSTRTTAVTPFERTYCYASLASS